MPAYVLIPFAVFFVCCAAQFWFLKRVRDRLIDQHPDTFLDMERSSIFPDQGLWRFTRGSKYKELRDEELNRRVRHWKRLILVAVLAWMAFAVPLFIAPVE